jgi:thioredoxin reductase
MYDVAVVGMGPAGIFALAFLPKDKLANTLVLEPNNIGGDLASYGGIKANITTVDIVEAFRKIPRWAPENKELTFLKNYKSDECPLLSDVTKQMREWILPDIKFVHFHTKRMTNLIESENGWKIETEGGEGERESELFEAQKTILCIGSKPKTLDLPKFTLPLKACLCKSQLEQHISATDKVVVIGTAHSGTLIMKNLYEIGCTGVVGIYKNKPFSYARDGVLGGIKQESAAIADAIVNNEWLTKTPTLISINDFSKAYRAIEKADVVICSCGYETVKMKYTDATGLTKALTYIPGTNQFDKLNNLWGFGMAFPSFKEDTTFPDIGFNGFIMAIQKQMPAILSQSV